MVWTVKGKRTMTDRLFFDTDCFSSFLWVHGESVLLELFRDRIILPQQVLEELCNPSIPHIRDKVISLMHKGDIATQQILTNTEEYELYYKMAISPPKGELRIGRGEAAALALAKAHAGIIASNNMRDIDKYIKRFQLKHITTGEILVSALEAGLINEENGNQIWSKMISKRRLLPASSFSDYLKIRKK